MISLTSHTDKILLEEYLADHDPEVFRALVERHGPDVLRVCRWVLRDQHEAEDAFQATFLLLLRKAPAIRDPELLGKWLRGAAYRIASRSRRHAARRLERERKRAEMVTTDSVTESFEHDVPHLLRDELDRLPDHYRAPLVLCYLEGFSHEETAKQLRWPAGTVKTRLVRGRNLLRQRLERRGVALGAAFLLLMRQHASAQTVPSELVEATVQAMTRAVASTRSAALSGPTTYDHAIRKSWAVTRGRLGPMISIVRKSRGARYFLFALLLSLGLIGTISYAATVLQGQSRTEVPQQWLAPNLTNVLGVDCR